MHSKIYLQNLQKKLINEIPEFNGMDGFNIKIQENSSAQSGNYDGDIIFNRRFISTCQDFELRELMISALCYEFLGEGHTARHRKLMKKIGVKPGIDPKVGKKTHPVTKKWKKFIPTGQFGFCFYTNPYEFQIIIQETRYRMIHHGIVLTQLRNIACLSQREVAENLGISEYRIQQIEKSKSIQGYAHSFIDKMLTLYGF